MQDYTSNSHKDRAKAEQQPDQPRPEVHKVVVGEVTVPKKTIGQKFMDTFFDGEFYKGLVRHVYRDVVIPNAKNVFFDVGLEALKLGVYRNGDASRLFDPKNIISRFSYQTPVQRSGGFPPGMTQVGMTPQRPIELNAAGPRNVVNADRKIFHCGTRTEAEDALEGMQNIIESDYKFVSLGEVRIMLGLDTSPVDNNWGWFSVADARVMPVRDGYLLELPPPEQL